MLLFNAVVETALGDPVVAVYLEAVDAVDAYSQAILRAEENVHPCEFEGLQVFVEGVTAE